MVQTPLWQVLPAQHTVPAVQGSPACVHAGIATPAHTPAWQPPLQHAASEEHASPSGVQVDAVVQAPRVQAPLQQSSPLAHGASIPAHCDALQSPASQTPLQHSRSVEQARFSSVQPPTGAPQAPLEHRLLQQSASVTHAWSSAVHAPPPGTGKVGTLVQPASDASETRIGQERSRRHCCTSAISGHRLFIASSYRDASRG